MMTMNPNISTSRYPAGFTRGTASLRPIPEAAMEKDVSKASHDTLGLSGVQQATDLDVLCGRGVSKNKHPGNVAYRAVVALNKELYVTSTKRQKMQISRSIVRSIREKGGRFLDQDPITNTWYDVGDRKAVEKTSQALRDGAAELRKQLSQDLADPEFLENLFDTDNTSAGNESKRKPRVVKAKKITKGHRRVHSDPDKLGRNKLLKRAGSKGLVESPADRSIGEESRAHSQPDERVLASHHSFDAYAPSLTYFNTVSYYPMREPSLDNYLSISNRGGHGPMRLRPRETSWNSFSGYGASEYIIPTTPSVDRAISDDGNYFRQPPEMQFPFTAGVNTVPATTEARDLERTIVSYTTKPYRSYVESPSKSSSGADKSADLSMDNADDDVSQVSPIPWDEADDQALLEFGDDLLNLPILSLHPFDEV